MVPMLQAKAANARKIYKKNSGEDKNWVDHAVIIVTSSISQIWKETAHHMRMGTRDVTHAGSSSRPKILIDAHAVTAW